MGCLPHVRLVMPPLIVPFLTPGSEGVSAETEASPPLVQGAGIALSASSSHLTRRLEAVDTSGTPFPTSSPTPSPTLSPTPAPECINHNVCGTPEYWERQSRILYGSLISVACVLCACFSACGYMDWRNSRVAPRNVIAPDNLTNFAHIRRAWREGGNGWTRTDRAGHLSGNGWTTDPAGFPGHTPASGKTVKFGAWLQIPRSLWRRSNCSCSREYEDKSQNG